MTQYVGAEIQPRAMTLWSLEAIQTEARTEMNRRGWEYLREIGFAPFKTFSMAISMGKRGTVSIVHIVASFEENHEQQNIRLEVPIQQFDALVPAEKEIAK